MMNSSSLITYGEWVKAGRGLRCKVPGMTLDDLAVAISNLPSQLAPYQLISVRLALKADRSTYVETLDEIEISEVATRACEGFFQFFLASRVLSPGVLLEPRTLQTSADLSLNGLVGIQYERPVRGERVPTEFHCVPQAMRVKDGAKVSFPEYEDIYRTLCRDVRRIVKRRQSPER